MCWDEKADIQEIESLTAKEISFMIFRIDLKMAGDGFCESGVLFDE